MKRMLIAVVATAMALPACRAACGRRAVDPPAGSLELVQRGQVTSDAAPRYADVDDDSDRFLVAGGRGPVNVWTEGAPTVVSPPASLKVAETVAAARFARLGEDTGAVFVASETGTVTLWSMRDLKPVYQHAFGGRSRHAELSADGRFVALGGATFERETGAVVGRTAAFATQSSLAFAAGGGRVAIAGFHEPWIVVRDLPGGEVREWPSPDKVGAVALDAAGTRLAAAMQDGHIRLWRLPSGEPAGDIATGAGRGASWRGLRFVGGDRQLVAADATGLSLCDAAGGKPLWRVPIDGDVMTFAVKDDLAATGIGTGAVVVWDLAGQRMLGRVQASTTMITAVGLSARRRRVAAADQHGEVTLWRW